MTILVGVLCKDDAVVIGTDSSATFGIAPEIPTIEQKPVQKLFVVEKDMLVAGTGQVGLCQRFVNTVEQVRGKDNKGVYAKTSIYVGTQMAIKCIEDFNSTSAPDGEFGALVAFATKSDKCSLVEYAVKDLQPVWKTSDRWFVSMGSGQTIADPILGLLRHVLFEKRQPDLAEGLFAVTWTLQLAIELNTGGIDGPPQIGTVWKEKDSYKAKILDDDELQEHISRVKDAESCLRKFLDLAESVTPKPPPDIPS